MTSADVARRDEPAGAEEPPGPPPADSHDDHGGGGGREPRWVRPVLVIGAVLALLLLGGAGGLLLGLHNATGDLVAPASDSVDVGFAQDMSTHHQQAVEMATWERDHTTSPELRQLAYDIESTQEAQIGRMQGWLALWGAPAQPSGGYMQWMGGAPAHPPGPAVARASEPSRKPRRSIGSVAIGSISSRSVGMGGPRIHPPAAGPRPRRPSILIPIDVVRHARVGSAQVRGRRA